MSPEAMCVAKVIKNTHDYYSEGVSSMKNEVSSRCYYKGNSIRFSYMFDQNLPRQLSLQQS